MVTSNYETNKYLIQDSYVQHRDSTVYIKPTNSYFENLKPNIYLLRQTLNTEAGYKSRSVSDRIFGNEIRQNYLGLMNDTSLLYERCKLHKQHINDIDRRHIEIQEKLFGVNINNFPDKAKRQTALEKDLLQLEQQRRDEELAFWKDSVELRKQIFDSAATYNTARSRYSLFSDVEAGDGFFNKY